MKLKHFSRTLTGAAVALALAAPAGAGTLYSWRTDDGGYAFADDLRRVPEKYRDRVETRESASLSGHDRYTPQDDAAVDAYASSLEARLEQLRQRSAALERIIAGQAAAAAQAAPAQAPGGVTVRMDSRGKPVIDIAPGATGQGEAPVVIEDVLGKPEGGIQTRTNTVIRRGDEVISVIRPLHDTQGPYPHNESDLDEGRF
jgi:hypothetical protein